MRKTIILGSLVTLLGLGSAALAGDQSNLNDNDTAQVTREASNDGRGDRRHRYERSERSRDRHDSREHRRSFHEKNESYDAHEAREHR